MDYGRYGLNGGAFGDFIKEASDPDSDVSKIREARAEKDFEEFCEQNSHARQMREDNARLQRENEQLQRDLTAAQTSQTVLEKELRGTGKVLVERLDRAGSWGVLVDAGALQALEARAAHGSIESDDVLDAYVHGTTQKFMQAVTGSLDADLQQEKEEKEGAK